MLDPQKLVVCLDNGHASTTLGKCSPDKSLYEWKYTRDLVAAIQQELECRGIKTFLVTPEADVDVALSTRASRVNNQIVRNQQQGYKTILISVHVNAAGAGQKWMNATGWECWTTVGKTNSDKLAEALYDAADIYLNYNHGIKLRTDMSDGDRDWEKNWTILYKANCPCVLTENLFMDSQHDVEFLKSYIGFKALVDTHVEGILRYCKFYA